VRVNANPAIVFTPESLISHGGPELTMWSLNLDLLRHCRILLRMYSLTETRLFTRLVKEYSTDHEYSKFVRDNIKADILRQICKEAENERS